MKSSILYIIILFTLINISCNNDSVSGNKTLGKDRFVMPTIPGDYEPKGLVKVSIMEMKIMGETQGLPPGVVYKDNKGNPVSSEFYANGPAPRFVQFYANSAGKVEEGVVHEMTPEMMSVMMLMRLATMDVKK